jgi:hypothetical protein
MRANAEEEEEEVISISGSGCSKQDRSLTTNIGVKSILALSPSVKSS